MKNSNLEGFTLFKPTPILKDCWKCQVIKACQENWKKDKTHSCLKGLDL
jgi:hypothetical protein